jgi:hypothetical protein
VSVAVMAQVWAKPPVGGSPLLVLLALADNASDDNRCAWPSIETLARKTCLSERSVQRALRDLEADGLLRIVRPGGRVGGQNRTTIWQVFPDPEPAANAPANRGRQIDGGDNPVGGDAGGTLGVTSVSPEPPVGTISSERGGARAGASGRGKLLKVGGKLVNPDSWDLTAQVLAAYNDAAGSKLRLLTSAGQPSEAAKRIYGRVRDYPDLTLDEHRDIIGRTLASKWWGDAAPTIGVVFGPKVFEDNITRSPSPRTSRNVRGRPSAGDLLQRIMDANDDEEEAA